MKVSPPKLRGNRKGFSMIGILLVLVIIFLVAGYFLSGSLVQQQQQDVGTYQYATERAKSVARGADLRALQQSIDMWVMAHPGERCTLEKLRADARYTIPQPPPGYHFEIDQNNKAILVQDKQTPPLQVRGVPTSPNPPR